MSVAKPALSCDAIFPKSFVPRTNIMYPRNNVFGIYSLVKIWFQSMRYTRHVQIVAFVHVAPGNMRRAHVFWCSLVLSNCAHIIQNNLTCIGKILLSLHCQWSIPDKYKPIVTSTSLLFDITIIIIISSSSSIVIINISMVIINIYILIIIINSLIINVIMIMMINVLIFINI